LKDKARVKTSIDNIWEGVGGVRVSDNVSSKNSKIRGVSGFNSGDSRGNSEDGLVGQKGSGTNVSSNSNCLESDGLL